MKRYTSLFLLLVCFLSLHAVWKWEQFPNPQGADVNFVYPNWLADDWQCGATGGIATICFAYSWMNDVPAPIIAVHARIYSDVPVLDEKDQLFSHPGNMLWEYIAAPFLTADSLGAQGWYDPLTANYLPNNHTHYYKNQIDVPAPLQFQQVSGTIYWLALSVELAPGSTAKIGWKTSAALRLDKNVYLDGVNWLMLPNNPVADSSYAFKVSNNPDDDCPVELSSFTATAPATGKVRLQWITQSETNLAGYQIYRNLSDNLTTAYTCSPGLIEGTNTSMQQTYQFDDEEVSPATTYWYWLESVDRDGTTNLFGPVSVKTADQDQPNTPVVCSTLLLGNNPNPFTTASNTRIRFSLSKDMNANLSIYNLKGQLVKVLTHTDLAVGEHQINWDGTDNQGHKVTAGVYFCRMQTAEYVSTHKLLLIK